MPRPETSGMPLPRTRKVAAGGRALGHLHRVRPLDAGDLDLAAEGQHREQHVGLMEQIVAVAGEPRILLDEDDHVEVASRAAADPGLAFALQSQALPRGDAGRDLDGQLALLLNLTLATAVRARLGDHLAGAPARAAGARHREETLLVAQLTRCRLHCPHVVGEEPAAAPLPLHVAQVSWRGIWIVCSTPVADC